ncbi:MAG: hypothetical protein Q4F58_00705 [Candidatus Saccharibacteria bacterium]|nr:hypothetical protein [Candidatus Saccharibacteria bacterium]
MVLHINERHWKVVQIDGLRGVEFESAAKFTDLVADETFIFPLVSAQNEIWQVTEDEFVLLCGSEFFHIGFSIEKGSEIFSRLYASSCRPLFNRAFFYFEDGRDMAHIYSVANRLEISDILKEAINPEISVTIKKSNTDAPMLICVNTYYASAEFLLRGLVSDDPVQSHNESIINPGREPIALALYDCTVDWVRSLNDFRKLAKERTREAKIAEYYEKCGGYRIDDQIARGIFTQKSYGDNTAYEFSPDEFFTRVAIPKLLAANGLVEVTPKKPCFFWGEMVDNPNYSIELTHDVLLVNEHTEKGDKIHALEMYDQACLGVYQVNETSFLAITSVPPDESNLGAAQLRHFVKYGPTGKFVWDDLTISTNGKCYVSGRECQLTDDIILFKVASEIPENSHSLQMWSIFKDRLVNATDTFANICWSKYYWEVAHSEKQILVKPIGSEYKRRMPKILLAMRFYKPKQYCDVYALVDPHTKFRIYGKVYNMLTDTVMDRPRTINDVINLMEQNEDWKAAISKHLSSTLNTSS